mgnify:CR=1 FL=1
MTTDLLARYNPYAGIPRKLYFQRPCGLSHIYSESTCSHECHKYDGKRVTLYFDQKTGRHKLIDDDGVVHDITHDCLDSPRQYSAETPLSEEELAAHKAADEAYVNRIMTEARANRTAAIASLARSL